MKLKSEKNLKTHVLNPETNRLVLKRSVKSQQILEKAKQQSKCDEDSEVKSKVRKKCYKYPGKKARLLGLCPHNKKRNPKTKRCTTKTVMMQSNKVQALERKTIEAIPSKKTETKEKGETQNSKKKSVGLVTTKKKGKTEKTKQSKNSTVKTNKHIKDEKRLLANDESSNKQAATVENRGQKRLSVQDRMSRSNKIIVKPDVIVKQEKKSTRPHKKINHQDDNGYNNSDDSYVDGDDHSDNNIKNDGVDWLGSEYQLVDVLSRSVCEKDYQLKTRIACGGYGCVFTACPSQVTGSVCPYVIKIQLVDNNEDEFKKLEEISIHKYLNKYQKRHRLTLSPLLRESWMCTLPTNNKKLQYMVMDKWENDFMQFLKQQTETHIQLIDPKLITGVSTVILKVFLITQSQLVALINLAIQLSEAKIVHGDLSLKNILYRHSVNDEDKMEFAANDFGLSTSWKDLHSFEQLMRDPTRISWNYHLPCDLPAEVLIHHRKELNLFQLETDFCFPSTVVTLVTDDECKRKCGTNDIFYGLNHFVDLFSKSFDEYQHDKWKIWTKTVRAVGSVSGFTFDMKSLKLIRIPLKEMSRH